ncbi:unnamed protein product [Wuchereria bancrofti]|uniref:Uncharacterized protein n=1 Tax=Wuchereria bancrofti TaxID=6293 RepID=A0A3P7DYN0_WUCBA|nr:unnamed protein product [Wuchereria bancrofti]
MLDNADESVCCRVSNFNLHLEVNMYAELVETNSMLVQIGDPSDFCKTRLKLNMLNSVLEIDFQCCMLSRFEEWSMEFLPTLKPRKWKMSFIIVDTSEATQLVA